MSKLTNPCEVRPLVYINTCSHIRGEKCVHLCRLSPTHKQRYVLTHTHNNTPKHTPQRHTHTHTHTDMCSHTHTHTHPHTHTRAHTQTHTHTHTHTHARAHMRANTHTQNYFLSQREGDRRVANCSTSR